MAWRFRTGQSTTWVGFATVFESPNEWFQRTVAVAKFSDLTCILTPVWDSLDFAACISWCARLVPCLLCKASAGAQDDTDFGHGCVTARWSEPRACYFHHPACSSPFGSWIVSASRCDCSCVCFLRTRFSWVISSWSYGLRSLYKSCKDLKRKVSRMALNQLWIDHIVL